MVKAFGEILDKKKLDTILSIYSRYIIDNYKQFKWRVQEFTNMGGVEGRRKFAVLRNEGNSDHNFEINLDYNPEYNTFNCSIYYNTFTRNHSSQSQSFPITSTKPKDLGKLAQNMFKWSKSIFDKI